MLPYILLLLIPLVLCAWTVKINGCRLSPEIAFFAILFLILCLRGISVGNDTNYYGKLFPRLGKIPWSKITDSHFESLFIALDKIVYLSGGSFRLFLIIIAFIATFPYLLLYHQNEEHSFLKLILYVNMSIFPMVFSGIRQSLAIAVVILAFFFVRRQKLLSFLLLVGIAYFFHKSALISLLIYPIYHIDIKKKHLLLIIPFLAFLMIFNRTVFTFLMRYFGGDYTENYGYITSTGAYTMFLLFVLFSVFCYLIPDDDAFGRDGVGLRNILLIATGIQIFASVNMHVMRLNYYFLPFIPLVMVRSVSTAKREYKILANVAELLICFVSTGYFYYKLVQGQGMLNIYPYVPMWN